MFSSRRLGKDGAADWWRVNNPVASAGMDAFEDLGSDTLTSK